MSSTVISMLLFAFYTVTLARPQVGLNQQLGAGVQPVPVAVATNGQTAISGVQPVAVPVDASGQTAISGVQPVVPPVAGNGQIATAVQPVVSAPVASGPVALPGGGTSERSGSSIPSGVLGGDPGGR